MRVTAPILRHGKSCADAEAIIDGDRTITYCELTKLILLTVTHLADLGVSPRDRIGICMADSADHLIILLALAQLGAVAVPLDWRARGPENESLITAARITLVLVGPEAAPIKACPSVTVDAVWHSSVARANGVPEFAGDWHDPFIISATSGSSGAPKLTLMTHIQYFFAAAGLREVLGLAGRHRYFNTLPLYYASGRNCCLTHLLRGDCVVLYPSLFDAHEYVEAADRSRATVAALVPSMVRRLLANAGNRPLLPGITALFSTGAMLSADEKRQALRQLTPGFHERYGTAETLAIAVLRPEAIADRANSVGQPHSLGEVEVVDDDGRPLPPGAVGKLRYRSPGVASPLAGTTSEQSFRDEWFYPGEMARLDELFYIFLEGRASEVIVQSGGVKIHPDEVERVLRECEGVVEAAVLGSDAAEDEQEVVAFLVAEREMTPGELIAQCRRRLTAHKVPARFHFVAALPTNTAGKIDKLQLRKLDADGCPPKDDPNE